MQNHQADSPLYVRPDVRSADLHLLIKSMVIHDTECPFSDQVSLNNTNQTKPNQTCTLTIEAVGERSLFHSSGLKQYSCGCGCGCSSSHTEAMQHFRKGKLVPIPATDGSTWVIPCQLIHFFADPSPILMKFGKLGGQQKKLIHTKFQHISTIFNGVRAL